MQDRKPEIRKSLDRVGVTGLKTIVMTNWKGRRYNFVPEIELTLDLGEKRKGIHMSRLIEAITESIEQEIEITHGSLEEVEKDILDRLKEKHPFKHAEISMKTDLVIQRKTPVTGKKTMETYGVEVRLISENGRYMKVLSVDVVGNTACPHAMNKCMGKTHIQRATGMLELETDYGNEIDLEDMIDCVEDAFPSRVYTTLKATDEKKVVEEMHENPRFVEDVTRSILDNAKKRFKDVKIKAKTVSEESIHRHNVIAEGTVEA